MVIGGDAPDAHFMFCAEIHIHTRGSVPGKKIIVGATTAKGDERERKD